MEPLKIFISYSHDDFRYMETIRKALAGKVQNREIEIWTDEEIVPGDDYDPAIRRALESADIILFLVSMNFISSWYIANQELKAAVERHKQGLVTLIPVLLEACDFSSLSLSAKEPLPMHNKRLKPLNEWTPRATGYQAVVKGLEAAIATLKKKKAAAAPPPVTIEPAPSPAAPPQVDPKQIQLLRRRYINNEFDRILAVFGELAPKLADSRANLSETLTSLSREWNEIKLKEINGDADRETAKKDFSRRLLSCISLLEKEFGSSTGETKPYTINNEGAKIGQQNIGSNVNNKGANFNIS